MKKLILILIVVLLLTLAFAGAVFAGDDAGDEACEQLDFARSHAPTKFVASQLITVMKRLGCFPSLPK